MERAANVRRDLKVRRSLLAPAVAAIAACSGLGQSASESTGTTESALTVGGCECVGSGTCAELSYSDTPSDGVYYLTTFGGGSDTQPMACGGTADGTWAYVADEARFGCGAKLQVTANGMSCVVQVADCGPNQCVEQAAANSGCTTHQPVLDASPLIAEYLFGMESTGWSDALAVKVVELESSAAIGCPSPGGADAGAPEDAGAPSSDASGGDAGDAGTDANESATADAGGPDGADAQDDDASADAGGGDSEPPGSTLDAGSAAVLDGGPAAAGTPGVARPPNDDSAWASGGGAGGCALAPRGVPGTRPPAAMQAALALLLAAMLQRRRAKVTTSGQEPLYERLR